MKYSYTHVCVCVWIMKRSTKWWAWCRCGWLYIYELLNWFTSKSNQYISLSFHSQIHLSLHILIMQPTHYFAASSSQNWPHTQNPRPKNTFRPKPYRIGNRGRISKASNLFAATLKRWGKFKFLSSAFFIDILHHTHTQKHFKSNEEGSCVYNVV